jgi:hypothetical protein
VDLKLYWLLFVIYSLVPAVAWMLPGGSNLEYEFQLYLAWMVALLPALIILFPAQGIIRQVKTFKTLLAFDTIWITFLAPIILMIFPVLLFLFDFCQCSLSGSIFWFFVQVFPNLVLGHALLHLVIVQLKKERSRLRIGKWIMLTVVSMVIINILILYLMPQKRTTSLLFGFLHGPIYDRWIPVDWGVLWLRSMHVAIAAALLTLTRSDFSWRRYFGAGSFALTALMFGFLAQQTSSVGHGLKVLERNFPIEKTNEWVKIYATDSANKLTNQEQRLEELLWEASFHVRDLSRYLKIKLKQPVKIFVYPNRNAKKLWFGGGQTDVTDVVGQTIHIVAESWPHSSLRHEIVHALTAQNGFWGLGFHPNMALTEGVATALAPQNNEFTLDQRVASLVYAKKDPDLAQLFGPLFWRYSSDRAYTVAGSFIKFLLQKFKPAKVLQWYNGDSFENVFGAEVEQVVPFWQKKVLKTLSKEKSEVMNRSIYRTSSVLDTTCPHSRQDLSRKRSSSIFVRLRQPVGWSPTDDFVKWRLQINPDDFRTLRSSWYADLKKLMSKSFVDRQQADLWLVKFSKASHWPPQHLEDIDLEIMRSDLLYALDQAEESQMLLNRLAEWLKVHSVPVRFRRRVQARIMLENQFDTENSKAWRLYLSGWRPLPRLRDYDVDSFLLRYLSIRNNKFSPSAKLMRQWLDFEVPPTVMNEFRVEWYFYLAKRLIERRDYSAAAKSLLEARKNGLGDQARYFEILRRQILYALNVTKKSKI